MNSGVSSGSGGSKCQDMRQCLGTRTVRQGEVEAIEFRCLAVLRYSRFLWSVRIKTVWLPYASGAIPPVPFSLRAALCP